MKVNIGPYLNWWGPYQIFGLLQKIGFNKEFTDSIAEKSPQWFADLCQWVYDRRKRKIKVEIHDYDVWSVDCTLAFIVVPLLEKLKKSKHGTPITMFEDSDGLDEYGNPTEEAAEKAKDRWQLILDKIIWSFNQIIEEDYKSFQIVQGEMDLNKYPEDEGKDSVPLRWSVEPKTNWDAYHAYQEHIQEGLELFGKHYQSFWT